MAPEKSDSRSSFAIENHKKMLFLIFLKFLCADWCSAAESGPEINSYSRVSTNGNNRDIKKWTGVKIDESVREDSSQARNFRVPSPVYVPQRDFSKLKNGEVVEHAQERFHPPASFEHVLAHSNRNKPDPPPMETKKLKFPVPSYATLPKEVYDSDYAFGENSKKPSDGPSLTIDEMTNSRPNSQDVDYYSHQIGDSYGEPEVYPGGSVVSPDPPKNSGTSKEKYPEVSYKKPEVYYGVNYESPEDDSAHDIVYEHPPDHYYDHFALMTTTTTEEPEVNDQRLSKKPYSYYYIGKKLWYVPLYFSIYFIIYVAALVLKSIARHKINFPASLAEAAAARNNFNSSPGYGWLDLTKRVLDGIDLYNSIDKNVNFSKKH